MFYFHSFKKTDWGIFKHFFNDVLGIQINTTAHIFKSLTNLMEEGELVPKAVNFDGFALRDDELLNLFLDRF